MSLVNIHDQLSEHDQVLEKEAAVELEKLGEEDAAGRIMARGFMDELHKLADAGEYSSPPRTPMATTGSIPSGSYQTAAATKKVPPGLAKRQGLSLAHVEARARDAAAKGKKVRSTKKVVAGGPVARRVKIQ